MRAISFKKDYRLLILAYIIHWKGGDPMNLKNTNSNKSTLYVISDDYINKLKKVDYRVQNNYREQRLYFKSNLKISN
ncbi:TPA: hypothetical protein ACGE70_002135, partial [Enterococcus faecium]